METIKKGQIHREQNHIKNRIIGNIRMILTDFLLSYEI